MKIRTAGLGVLFACAASAMPATIISYLGQGNTLSPSTQTGIPAGMQLAVGPNHVVQVVNGGIAVWDKNGASVLASKTINNLWAGYTGTNANNGCSTRNDGEPVVLYDALANRWLVAQFSIPNTSTSGGPSFECIAVSKTADPTGGYWLYDFKYLYAVPDDARFAVWSDGYYAAYNTFNSTFGGELVCAYDRASMLAGQAATQQCHNLGMNLFGLVPANFSGSVPPPSGEPETFATLGTNSLALFKMHVDWNNVANTTVSGPTSIPVNSFTELCGSTPCVAQPTGQQLWGMGDRLDGHVVYRNFGTHETVLASHSVVAGTSSGVRWYEVRGVNGTPAVFQQGTYAPDSQWRWMSAIGQDQAGGIVVGYSLRCTAPIRRCRWSRS
jgi:hypothetical protein